MRLLITGGLGFIGSNFIHLALKNELAGIKVEKLHVLDKLTYAADINRLNSFKEDSRLEIQLGDVCEFNPAADLISKSDVVVHFAAETHVDRSITDGNPFITTNVVGTANLARICRELGKTLVVISTDEVYGSIEYGEASEEYILNPSSPYAASKAAGDLIALSEYKTFGADIRITRCTNNYGLYQFPEKLIPLAISNLSRGETVPVYGDGTQQRDWISVEDHCQAISKVILFGKAGEIYNIGQGNPITNLDILEMILGLMKMPKSHLENVADRLGHDQRYAINSDKTRRNFDWKPKDSLLLRLPEMIEHYSKIPISD
jgi:dTDP-glucose 4,6-dehydratase